MPAGNLPIFSGLSQAHTRRYHDLWSDGRKSGLHVARSRQRRSGASFRRRLGIGGKSVVIPVSALDVTRDEDGDVHAETTCTKEQIEALPEHAHLWLRLP